MPLLTPAQLKVALEDLNVCPFCESGNINYDSTEQDGSQAWQNGDCINCKECWQHIYKLVGIAGGHDGDVVQYRILCTMVERQMTSSRTTQRVSALRSSSRPRSRRAGASVRHPRGWDGRRRTLRQLRRGSGLPSHPTRPVQEGLTMTSITFDEWEARFKPVLQANGMAWRWFDNLAAEDLTVLKATPTRRIWTVYDGPGTSIYIAPGAGFVNRLAYAITELPWAEEELSNLVVEDPDGADADEGD